jgi:hypothetical protein
MDGDLPMSLSTLYKDIIKEIDSFTENEIDDMSHTIYDIIQDRKEHLRSILFEDIINDHKCTGTVEDLEIIIKGNSKYESLDDMLEALFCDNLKSAFGVM